MWQKHRHLHEMVRRQRYGAEIRSSASLKFPGFVGLALSWLGFGLALAWLGFGLALAWLWLCLGFGFGLALAWLGFGLALAWLGLGPAWAQARAQRARDSKILPPRQDSDYLDKKPTT